MDFFGKSGKNLKPFGSICLSSEKKLSGRPGLVVTHFVSRFLYFLRSIFREAKVLSEPLGTIE